MSLISAERLHRWKCIYCGSKDKNIVNIMVNDPKTGEAWAGEKIVTCSQCGHTETFAHSSLVHASIMTGIKQISLSESEEYVKNFHHINHDDPMRNPHSAHDESLPHNPGTLHPHHKNTI